MKIFYQYISVLTVFGLLNACTMEETFDPVADKSDNDCIEFVARPTNFIKSNVSTKATSAEIDAIENTIHTAYFLLYDNSGELVSYTNLTNQITSEGNVPSQTISTDKGLGGATVCYIANLPESVVKEKMTNLTSLQNAVLDITYADETKLGCIGVPTFDLDDDTSTPSVNCLPMFGSWTGDITGLSDNQTIEIPVKRLFAKINFIMKMNLTGGLTGASSTPYLDFESFVLHNIPTKVSLAPSQVESAWVTSNTDSDFLSPITVPVYHTGEGKLENQEQLSFYFYIPEYILDPIVDGNETEDWYHDRDEGYKPVLAGDKKAIYVGVDGLFYTVQGQYLEVAYKIYLGENNFDSFSLRRNYLYNNTVEICGTTDGTFNTDHRVDIDYNAFLVGFERATLLDSHFEVRPLRIKFSQDFIEENNAKGADLRDGILSVEILNADSDGGTKPAWVRMERPLLSTSDSKYCLGGLNTSHTKRKYFTIDLVTNTLKDNISVSYNPFSASSEGGDLTGDVPIWIYIDEYGASDVSEYSADEVRSAKIRVTYTPNDPNEEVLSQDFSIQQRAIYPIQTTGWDGTARTFGIEYFEEYLHDYDSQDNYGAEGGDYFTSQSGIPWGFDGEQISNTDRALYFNSNDDNLDIGDLANLATSNMNLFYDFYLTRDKDSSSDNIVVHDYSGYEFNQKIITQEGIDRIHRKQNEQTQSVIEYCYNKNKRNTNGTIVESYTTTTNTTGTEDVIKYYKIQTGSFFGRPTYTYYHITWTYPTSIAHTDTYINNQNLKWYVPAIDELEDIVVNGMGHDFFREVFTNNYYWSSQPAYNRNYFQYILGIGSDRRTFGIYLEDHLQAARATRYDTQDNNFISSDIYSDDLREGYFESTTLYGFVIVDNYMYHPNPEDGDFVPNLTGSLSGTTVNWTKGETVAVTSYKKMDGTYMKIPEGIKLRSEPSRVRCIYNPNPQDTYVGRETKTVRASNWTARKETNEGSVPDTVTEYTTVKSLPTNP